MLVAPLVAASGYPADLWRVPAVQVSSTCSSVKTDTTTLNGTMTLKDATSRQTPVTLDGVSIRARFGDTDTQLKSQGCCAKALAPTRQSAMW
jgi:preprotein translocase subunit SecD